MRRSYHATRGEDGDDDDDDDDDDDGNKYCCGACGLACVGDDYSDCVGRWGIGSGLLDDMTIDFSLAAAAIQ